MKSKSHGFFDSMDRRESSTLLPTIGSSFTKFERGWIDDWGRTSKAIAADVEQKAPNRTRTWREEHVFLGRGTATFIGEAVEHFPAHDDQPATEYDAWNTLVWVREGADWKVVHWQCAPAGVDADRTTWNETYRHNFGFKQEPNKLLVDVVKGRKAGTALDVAMGQGRNALFLASQGWKVTGFDISDEGLRIARESAAKRRLPLEAVNADVDTWDYGKERWDLVAMIYAGGDAKTIAKVKTGLRPGGLFVAEAYWNARGAVGPGIEDGLLPSLFGGDGYTILRSEVVEDIADWGHNRTKLVRFVAQKRP